MPRTRVFTDTNVILEAFRTRCWTAICQYYSVEAVEKCIEEALTIENIDYLYLHTLKKPVSRP